jgi:O-antigen ligase
LWPEGLARLETVKAMVTDLIGSGQITEVSAGERQVMYQAGIAAFRDAPWFGYGWEQRLPAIQPYLPTGFTFASIHHHLHSDSLDFGVSGGLVGLLAYVLALVAPIAGALRSARDSLFRFRLTGAVGLSLGYAIFGITYLTFGYEYHTTLYVCLSAILTAFCTDKPAT